MSLARTRQRRYLGLFLYRDTGRAFLSRAHEGQCRQITGGSDDSFAPKHWDRQCPANPSGTRFGR